MENVSTDKLRHDLRAIAVDTQDLLKTTAAQTGERVEKIRAQAEETLRSARALLQEVGHSAEELGCRDVVIHEDGNASARADRFLIRFDLVVDRR